MSADEYLQVLNFWRRDGVQTVNDARFRKRNVNLQSNFVTHCCQDCAALSDRIKGEM